MDWRERLVQKYGRWAVFFRCPDDQQAVISYHWTRSGAVCFLATLWTPGGDAYKGLSVHRRGWGPMCNALLDIPTKEK